MTPAPNWPQRTGPAPTRCASPAPALECTGWKPLRERRSTLAGFADVRLPRAGFTLAGCLVHLKEDGSAWCVPPALPIYSGGERTGWKDLVAFDSPEARRAWSAAAVAAVAAYRAEHPEADAPPEVFEW